SEDEMIALIHGMIAAGSDSTAHAICFTVHTLLRHPEQLEEIRRDPSLLRNAVEEALRFDTFLKALPKFCREELTIGGVRIRKGQMVFSLIGSALHDP